MDSSYTVREYSISWNRCLEAISFVRQHSDTDKCIKESQLYRAKMKNQIKILFFFSSGHEKQLLFNGKLWPLLQLMPVGIVSMCYPKLCHEEGSAEEPLTCCGVGHSHFSGCLLPSQRMKGNLKHNYMGGIIYKRRKFPVCCSTLFPIEKKGCSAPHVAYMAHLLSAAEEKL